MNVTISALMNIQSKRVKELAKGSLSVSMEIRFIFLFRTSFISFYCYSVMNTGPRVYTNNHILYTFKD